MLRSIIDAAINLLTQRVSHQSYPGAGRTIKRGKYAYDYDPRYNLRKSYNEWHEDDYDYDDDHRYSYRNHKRHKRAKKHKNTINSFKRLLNRFD